DHAALLGRLLPGCGRRGGLADGIRAVLLPAELRLHHVPGLLHARQGRGLLGGPQLLAEDEDAADVQREADGEQRDGPDEGEERRSRAPFPVAAPVHRRLPPCSIRKVAAAVIGTVSPPAPPEPPSRALSRGRYDGWWYVTQTVTR